MKTGVSIKKLRLSICDPLCVNSFAKFVFTGTVEYKTELLVATHRSTHMLDSIVGYGRKK